jgi:hypothetical protein
MFELLGELEIGCTFVWVVETAGAGAAREGRGRGAARGGHRRGQLETAGAGAARQGRGGGAAEGGRCGGDEGGGRVGGSGADRAVALQHPQHCATGRACCILQQEMQQLLDFLQYLLFLHFGDATSFAQAVGDSLTFLTGGTLT